MTYDELKQKILRWTPFLEREKTLMCREQVLCLIEEVEGAGLESVWSSQGNQQASGQITHESGYRARMPDTGSQSAPSETLNGSLAKDIVHAVDRQLNELYNHYKAENGLVSLQNQLIKDLRRSLDTWLNKQVEAGLRLEIEDRPL